MANRRKTSGPSPGNPFQGGLAKPPGVNPKVEFAPQGNPTLGAPSPGPIPPPPPPTRPMRPAYRSREADDRAKFGTRPPPPGSGGKPTLGNAEDDGGVPTRPPPEAPPAQEPYIPERYEMFQAFGSGNPHENLMRMLNPEAARRVFAEQRARGQSGFATGALQALRSGEGREGYEDVLNDMLARAGLVREAADRRANPPTPDRPPAPAWGDSRAARGERAAAPAYAPAPPPVVDRMANPFGGYMPAGPPMREPAPGPAVTLGGGLNILGGQGGMGGGGGMNPFLPFGLPYGGGGMMNPFMPMPRGPYGL